MKINKEDLGELVYQGDTDNWKFLQQELTDTWRWGEVYDTIVQHRETKQTYLYKWKVSSGDGEYTSLDDEGAEVVLTPVYPKLVTTVVYVTEESDAD